MQISNLNNSLPEIPIYTCKDNVTTSSKSSVIYVIIGIIFPVFMKMLISTPISR